MTFVRSKPRSLSTMVAIMTAAAALAPDLGCSASPAAVSGPPDAQATGGTDAGGQTGTGGALADAVDSSLASGGAGGGGGSVAGDTATFPDGAPETGGGAGGGAAGGAGPADSIVWAVDNLTSIGGHPTTVLGAPTLVDGPGGKAVAFNGTSDGLIVDNHPLAGLARFTVEVIFRPDPGGAPEQRFFHMQEATSENRVLFETRVPGDGTWFIDTYVQSGGGGAPLLAAKYHHPIGPWYRAALIVDGTRMRHFVNGVEEMSTNLAFQPHKPGKTSFGVRQNQMYWYKGAIRMARFTPRVLTPDEFLPQP